MAEEGRGQPQPTQEVDSRPTTASRMQLEVPLHASPPVPTPMSAPSSGNVVPDINDIDPMDDMD
eukprot:9762996-Alexandrium_andersonii.AAC.1